MAEVDVFNVNSELTKLLHSNKFYQGKEIEWLTKFNRFGALDLYNKIAGSHEFVFFTKPDLNLFEGNGHQLTQDAARNSILYDINRRYPNVLKQLQLSASNGPFMTILSNSIKNTVDLPSIQSEIMETSSTVYGSKLFYRKHSLKSDEAHEVSLEFEDTKYLELYAMFKAWDEYSNMKALGTITAKDLYVDNNILDDQIAIYKIIVSADYTTILFYAKLTGCIPTAVPRDAFSELDDKLIYNIPWKATWVEDNDPIIIEEFNRLTSSENLNKYSSHIGLYNQSSMHTNAELVSKPFIVSDGNNYKLRWR